MLSWPFKFGPVNDLGLTQETASSCFSSAVEEASTAFEVVATQEQEILGASSEPKT